MRQTDRQTGGQKYKYTPVYIRVALSGAVALTVKKNIFTSRYFSPFLIPLVSSLYVSSQ